MAEEHRLHTVMERYRARAERVLEDWLPAVDIQPERLHQAMRYATLGGGKRLRSILVYAAGAAVGGAQEALDRGACAVELIHAYSLVHDDLPAMDDDPLRRGQPTVHRAFDEATAILAGDALQALAFYVLTHDPRGLLDAGRRAAMVEALALAAGSRGMAGGQALDLAAVGRQLSLPELEGMHIHKTGALIRASVQLGCLAAESLEAGTAQSLDHYAKCLGLAFQIQDDVLDVEGDTAVLGKERGADAARNKPTYPALLGLAGAKEMARELVEDAQASLARLGAEVDPLRWLAEYVVTRTR